MNEIKSIITDMDGTLYKLVQSPYSNQKNGWSGSVLRERVNTNLFQFVSIREPQLSDAEVIILLTKLKAAGNVSIELAKKYGISRESVFNEVWNISPDGLIEPVGNIAINTLKQLKEGGGEQITLLTAAPSVWTTQVLDLLGSGGLFNEVITAERFTSKAEIFRLALKSGRFAPSEYLSIGDQLETDISPAKELGMQTLLVTSPNDFNLLLSENYELKNNY